MGGAPTPKVHAVNHSSVKVLDLRNGLPRRGHRRDQLASIAAATFAATTYATPLHLALAATRAAATCASTTRAAAPLHLARAAARAAATFARNYHL